MSDLARAVATVVRRCLGISSGEEVLVVADPGKLDLGHAFRDEAARAGAAPPTLRDAELEAYLDRFTRPGQPSFSTLAHAVRTARDRGELLASARALFAWKKDMIR